MQVLHNIDILIVCSYLIFCLALGLYKAKDIKNLRHFAVGARNAKAPLLTCVIFATVIGAGSTIGIVEKVYLLGLAFVIRQLLQPVSWLISARIFGANIERFKGCLTISQVMYRLYGNTGRWITNILSLIVSAGALSAQATAIGYIFHYFFSIGIYEGMFISYSILGIYSTLGGIRAVVVTEVFQFAIFFFIIPLAFVVTVVMHVDELLANIPNYLPATHISLLPNDNDILLFFSLILYALLPDVSGPIMQRYLMASNSKELVKSLKTVALISIPFVVFLCLIGILLKVIAPAINPAEAMFYFASHLPIGVKGFMVAGLLAIAMSTAESWINSASVILINDVVKPVFPNTSDRMQLILVRIFTIVISIISVSIAAMEESTLDLVWGLHSIWIPVILIPLAAGFLGFKTSNNILITSILSALIFVASGRIIAPEAGIVSISTGLIGSAIGFFGAYYWQFHEERWSDPANNEQNTPTIQLNKKKHELLAWIKRFARKFESSLRQDNIRVSAFAGFTLFYYLGYSLMLYKSPANIVLAILMGIGYMLCGIILMKDILFSKRLIKKYLLPYFYLTIIFCQPTIASFMLFACQGNSIWIISGMLSAFSVFFFLNAISSMFVITIGIIFGYILFMACNNYIEVDITTHHTFVATYIYLFFMAAVLLFLRPKEKTHEEKIEHMQLIGGAIAHEARSPIATVIMASGMLTSIMKDAVSRARPKNGYYNLKLAKDDYDMLLSCSLEVEKASRKGLKTVDNILLMHRTSVTEENKKESYISDIIKGAIDEFILYNAKAREVEVRIESNFKVLCVPTALTHVLFNLLKNAYKHGGKNVRVEIRTRSNKLYFKDYGKGIEEEVLPYIFDRFYTNSRDGTGLGLAYCKMVMESLGGNIECESKLNKYTVFTLAFPNLTSDEV